MLGTPPQGDRFTLTALGLREQSFVVLEGFRYSKKGTASLISPLSAPPNRVPAPLRRHLTAIAHWFAVLKFRLSWLEIIVESGKTSASYEPNEGCRFRHMRNSLATTRIAFVWLVTLEGCNLGIFVDIHFGFDFCMDRKSWKINAEVSVRVCRRRKTRQKRRTKKGSKEDKKIETSRRINELAFSSRQETSVEYIHPYMKHFPRESSRQRFSSK